MNPRWSLLMIATLAACDSLHEYPTRPNPDLPGAAGSSGQGGTVSYVAPGSPSAVVASGCIGPISGTGCSSSKESFLCTMDIGVPNGCQSLPFQELWNSLCCFNPTESLGAGGMGGSAGASSAGAGGTTGIPSPFSGVQVMVSGCLGPFELTSSSCPNPQKPCFVYQCSGDATLPYPSCQRLPPPPGNPPPDDTIFCPTLW